MSLSFIQEQAITELAKHFYGFLPGQAHPYADQSISFQGAAKAAGVGQFWPGGSKQPATAALLRNTLENRPNSFCVLINEIVRKALAYRQNKPQPLTREEIQTLNDILLRLSFKIPELRDPKFLNGLPSATVNPPVSTAQSVASLPSKKRKELLAALRALSSLDPQPRGFAFEEFLKVIFSAFDLAPRSSFRLVGEQIDGSFQLQGETYLVEATWRNMPVGQEELLAFSGKVSGKAAWSRGLLLSYAGFSSDGLEAFARGKPTVIVCMEGLCLNDALDRGLDLAKVIERKVRRAAETNEAFVRVRDLFPEAK